MNIRTIVIEGIEKDLKISRTERGAEVTIERNTRHAGRQDICIAHITRDENRESRYAKATEVGQLVVRQITVAVHPQPARRAFAEGGRRNGDTCLHVGPRTVAMGKGHQRNRPGKLPRLLHLVHLGQPTRPGAAAALRTARSARSTAPRASHAGRRRG